jgi:hypothetical protein
MVATTLGNISFIGAKVEAGKIFELLEDYNQVTLKHHFVLTLSLFISLISMLLTMIP